MSDAPRIVSVMTTASRGGAEYANVDLLTRLAQRGWQTTLLTNLPDLVDGTPVEAREINLGPKLTRRDAPRVLAGFPLYAARLRRALEGEYRRAPIDVTLLHFKKEQLMTALLPAAAGRIVWAEWGPLPMPMRRPPARSLYAAAAARAAHVIAVSDATRDSLVRAGVPASRVSVLPPVVAADVSFDAAARARMRAEWGATDETFVVGCVSRLSSGKRVDVIIDAVARMSGDVMLVIAGGGSNAAALRARAEPLGTRVRFLPTVRGHVSEVLSGFDVQVFAPQPQEGLPRSLMLGMLMGLCVLATGPEGAAPILGAAAVASGTHDPAAVAELLERHRADPGLCRREGEALRAAARERFNPERIAEAAERVLLGRG
jgi:glycosyltransferase involved in cell wall biosynthesis